MKKNRMKKILSMGLVGAMILGMSAMSFADTSEKVNSVDETIQTESTYDNQNVNINELDDEQITFDFEDPYNITYTGTILFSDVVDGEGRILLSNEVGQIAIFNIDNETLTDMNELDLKVGDEVLVGYNVATSMCQPGSVYAQFITVVDVQ